MRRSSRDKSDLDTPPRRTPKISRRISACQACQNRKIKCDLQPGQNTCARCRRLGIECVVNKTLQTLLDEENGWKKGIENQIRALQEATAATQRALYTANGFENNHILPPAEIPFSRPIVGAETHPSVSSSTSLWPMTTGQIVNSQGTITAMTRENSSEPATEDPGPDTHEEAIVGAPMASLFEVTKLRNIRSDPSGGRHSGPLERTRRQQRDFIAQGKMSVVEAELLFATFQGTLNAYLWGGIALVHSSFAAAHESSPLLTAAILAVTALHAQDGGRSFDVCYSIFLDLVSQSIFDRFHTLDDVRALCIGAFWLSDVSWKLSGLAVRIGTELNLHRSCFKSKPPTAVEIEKARLWYFLYVCDRHFSIAYGRPPVINQSPLIDEHQSFLDLPGITQADYRLHSQVEIFIILSRIYQDFGLDNSKMVGNDQFEAIRRFDVEFHRWRDYWVNKLCPDKHIAAYPGKGVVLHFYFARLQLYSLCLRGINPSTPFGMSSDRCQYINVAIASALSALRLILSDEHMRKAVIGVPLYLLTTIAFASMFLMKVQLRWGSTELDINFDIVSDVVGDVVCLLDNTQGHVRHLSHYIGRGLHNMLEKTRRHEEWQQRQRSSASKTPPSTWDGLSTGDWAFDGNGVMQPGGEDFYPLDFLELLHSQMPV